MREGEEGGRQVGGRAPSHRGKAGSGWNERLKWWSSRKLISVRSLSAHQKLSFVSSTNDWLGPAGASA